jgi:hypothetical protein
MGMLDVGVTSRIAKSVIPKNRPRYCADNDNADNTCADPPRDGVALIRRRDSFSSELALLRDIEFLFEFRDAPRELIALRINFGRDSATLTHDFCPSPGCGNHQQFGQRIRTV